MPARRPIPPPSAPRTGWRTAGGIPSLVVAALAVLVLVLAGGCSAGPVAPPAPAPPRGPDQQPEPSRVVVAVDNLGAGFNPHLLAHQSPTTTAVAALVLPSVFRPDAAGVPQLDTTVVTRAKVTSNEPFTVSYEIDLRASWSSNAPIAAEDFVYLWEQMRSEPGVADAAGYRLITDIRSRAGGKAVDVVFAEPYPAWQSLFSNLLPAHILKDAPGSWVGALTAGLPASGGPFRIVSVDRGRGEIVLGRNDLYWATPTVLDQLTLRRVDRAALPGAFAAGDVDIALAGAGPRLREALAGQTPPLRLQTAPQPVVTELGMRLDAGPLADAGVRRAVAGLVDREAIRVAVAPEAPPAASFGQAPSQPGYAPTAPPPPDAAEIERLLVAAGWARGPSGAWTVDGAPVRLVVGAAAERGDDVRVAELVAAQLTAAGIEAAVVAPPAVALFSQATVPPDLPTTTPASTPVPTSRATDGTAIAPEGTATATGAAPPGPGSVAPTPTATPTRTVVPGPDGTVRVDLTVLPRSTGGAPAAELDTHVCPPPTPLVPDPPDPPAGACVPQLRPLFGALLTGVGGDAVRDLVERELWQGMPALPLFQPVTLVASTPAADAATGVAPGPLTTGPLTGAQRWSEPAR